MKLEIENIGKIEKGVVEIGGLTIVAGENDTGKSTIGKVLYSLINGKDNLLNTFVLEFKKNLISFGKNKAKIKFDNFEINILKRLDKYDPMISGKDDNKYIRAMLIDSIELELLKLKKEMTKSTEVHELVDVPVKNRGGVSTFFNRNEPMLAKSTETKTEKIDLNELISHKIDLLNKVKDGLLKYNKQSDISKIKNFELIEEMAEIIGGHWEFNETNNEFYFVKKENSDNYFSSINTASGIKNFLIIDGLIKGDYLNENTILIIDEPEAHLHPEWQVKYAEVIVKLLEKNIPIVIITHSGDFLQGLMNLITKKQGLINKTSISYVENMESGTIIKSGGYNIKENEELLSKIYDNLTAPSWRIINNG